MFKLFAACVSKKAGGADSPRSIIPSGRRRSRSSSASDNSEHCQKAPRKLRVGEYAVVVDSGRQGKIVQLEEDRWPIHVEFYDGRSPTSQWYQPKHLRVISKRTAHWGPTDSYNGVEASSLCDQSDCSKSTSAGSTRTSSGGTASSSDTRLDIISELQLDHAADPMLTKDGEVIFRKSGRGTQKNIYMTGDRGRVLAVDDQEHKVEVLISKNHETVWVMKSEVCALPKSREVPKEVARNAGRLSGRFGLPPMQAD